MLTIENVDVHGWEAAIRGMRNPKNSWEKSDSESCQSKMSCEDCPMYDGEGHCYNHDTIDTIIGPNDHKLMMSLRNAGTDHRKFMRMIAVWLDITAPLYWWKEFDTYKVGTVANSCSTMHKIHAKKFTMDDFSCEHLIREYEPTRHDGFVYLHDAGETWASFSPMDVLEITIQALNVNRESYLETKDKKYWWQMIQLLPSSYNQRRTVMLNYEVLANIYKSRRHHKLDEWHTFCDWIESLPYSELITGKENTDGNSDA